MTAPTYIPRTGPPSGVLVPTLRAGVLSSGSLSYLDRLLATRPGNLIGLWPLNEQSVTVAVDASGNGRNGAYTGVDFNVPGANLLTNGGFETAGANPPVFAGWTGSASAGGGAVLDESITVYSGGHAAKLVRGTGSSYVAHVLPVVPGVAYNLHFWACGDGSNAGLYKVHDDTNNTDLIPVTSTGITATVYQLINMFVTTPTGCTSITLTLYSAPPVAGNFAYFDDVSVSAVSPNGIGDGGNAPYWDGVNDYCNLYSAGLNGAFSGAEGTVMGWAKAANAGVWGDATLRNIVRLAADGGANQLLIQKGTVANQLTFQYSANSVASTVQSTVTAFSGWFHVALTWSKALDQVKAYLNGAQLGTTQTGLGVYAGALSSTRSCFGASTTTPAAVWLGNLAWGGLWNVALNSSEIAGVARL